MVMTGHLSYLLIPLEEKGVGGPTQTFGHDKTPATLQLRGLSLYYVSHRVWVTMFLDVTLQLIQSVDVLHLEDFF